MANCNKLFLDFNKEITPTALQMQKMKTSRVSLEGKICKKLKEELGMTVTYFTQGSGASGMKTIIIKADGTYDADRGVYLPKKPDLRADKVQKLVFEAVSNHTSGGASHRNKCIRVIYQAEYNIDFPVYYESSGETYSYLALKSGEWIKDDPSHMIVWFNQRKDEYGQLIRLVKYLKAWTSFVSSKMPSGIAITVWAAEHYTKGNERDDIALANLLMSLKNSLSSSVYCCSPVEPFDDLTAKLSVEQKGSFFKELTDFAADAQKAIAEPNQLKASQLWRNYFGDRFKEGVDQDLSAKEKALLAASQAILSGNAKLDQAGKINSNTGVSHQPHRNYGF